MALPANPAQVLTDALAGDIDRLPERVLYSLLRTWDNPEHGGPLRIMVGAARTEPGIARVVREIFERDIVAAIAERLGGSDARPRAATFAAQLIGVIFTRYILAVEPITTMPADELVRRLSPALREALRPRPSSR
jgi:hypothetical protein